MEGSFSKLPTEISTRLYTTSLKKNKCNEYAVQLILINVSKLLTGTFPPVAMLVSYSRVLGSNIDRATEHFHYGISLEFFHF
jgi:hypothetical protein